MAEEQKRASLDDEGRGTHGSGMGMGLGKGQFGEPGSMGQPATTDPQLGQPGDVPEDEESRGRQMGEPGTMTDR